MRRAGSFLANLGLLLLGIMVALAGAELLLRVTDPFQFRVKGERIILPTNLTYQLRIEDPRWESPDVVNRKNSLGFRGAEPPPDLASRLSIVAVGGSTTECFYLTEGRTWPDRLAGLLSDHVSRLWLNNAGLDGHSTFGHIVLMRDLISTLRPKLVIYLVGINDVGSAAPRPADRRNFSDEVDFSSAYGIVNAAANRSEVVSLAINLARAWKARSMKLVHDLTPLDPKQRDDIRVPDAALDAELAEHRQKYVGAYRERLAALLQATRAAGIEPVFVTQPTLYGPALDDRTGLDLGGVAVGSGNGLLYWRVLELYNDELRAVAREAGLLLIDLASEMPKSSRLFYDSVHFTEAGAAEAARILARRLCPHLQRYYPDHAGPSCPA